MQIGRFVSAVLTVVLIASCELISPLGKQSPQVQTLNLDTFEQTMLANIGQQWDGFAYAINQNGNLRRSDFFGLWDRSGTSADLTTPIYGSSINKFVAAVAVMKVMQNNPGVDLDNGIAGFLPPAWGATNDLSAFIQTVTIRGLLTHTSGIPGPQAGTFNSDYTTLRNIAQNGLGVAPAAGYAYSNANYGFLRMFIASMNGASYWGTDQQMENTAIGEYRMFMENEVFSLAGQLSDVGTAGIAPTTNPSSALYYLWNQTSGGWVIGDRSANLASGGYYFSVLDLAQFLAYLNHSEQIITAANRQILYDAFFGLSDGAPPPLSPNGARGWYYSKAGSLADGTGRGNRNVIAILPGGIEVVFMANSRGGVMDGTGVLRNAIFAAYDASWE